jgi:diguanylate cyclase (GGDEF)-like protein
MRLGDRPVLRLRVPARLAPERRRVSGRVGLAVEPAPVLALHGRPARVAAVPAGLEEFAPTPAVAHGDQPEPRRHAERDAPPPTSTTLATTPEPTAGQAAPDTPADPQLDDAAATLAWLAYVSTLTARVSVVEDAVLLALEGRLDDAARRRSSRAAQKLAGSLWLVDAQKAGSMAWEAAGLLEPGTLLGTSGALRLAQLVESLHDAVRALPAPEALKASARTQAPLLLVVDDDEGLARELPIEAAVRGWRVKVTRSLREVEATLAPAVIALGPDASSEADAGPRALLRRRQPDARVVCLAADGSLDARDAALHIDAHRTLSKPVSPALLVQAAIDLARGADAPRPVVVVALDAADARALACRLLEPASQIVVVDEGGDTLWHAVSDLQPDLVVVDERCAGGTALPFVHALRRDASCAHIGVVLVIDRVDLATVTRACGSGVDDYVPGASLDVLLPGTVRTRLERLRVLREAQHLDPATRLPLLALSLGALARMVATARRYGQALSVLVCEVDGMAGDGLAGGPRRDQLALQLGRRLGRAFRTEDLVARDGHGRYVVAAYGMRAEDGVQRMAELLEAFREQAVPGDGGVAHHASFSAGIAQLRVDGPDLGALLRAAGGALTRARRAGGNRVIAAGRTDAASTDSSADVVILDPDQPFAELVAHALETRGLRARRLADGQEAAELLSGPAASITTRLLVLELGLAGLDGLALLRQLRDTGVLRTMRAIVVTTRSVESEMLQALELGATDYVTKPVSLPVLMRRLQSALGAPGDAR